MHIEKGIKTTAAKLRRLSTGRKRAAMAAMVGAAVAAVLGLAVPAGASSIAANPAAVTGAEHFQIMSTATNNSPNSPLIAWGVFTGAGVDREISSNAAGTKGVDTFIFANGKFTVKHTAKTQKQSFNTKTCFYAFSQTGVFTLSGGTGKYKGISGSGKFALSVVGIGPKLKSGACNPNQNARSIANQQEIVGNASVRLP
jgi:hypothetical protein